ncbi:MAG TPA: hypothetical protein VNZ27_11025 [Rhodanobacter sp.]|jgi:hypothetical protein|nr:hypothetical protein [Rhodanobacter sp.]
MNIKRHLTALATTLLVATASAQTTSKPLNLKLPPSDIPAPSTTAAKPTSSAPGAYYGDTSGRMGNTSADVTTTSGCDDSTFNQAQVHGSVSAGVVSGSHMGTGTWNAGTVNLSKRFGDCDHPTGGVSISVGGGSGNFHGRGH